MMRSDFEPECGYEFLLNPPIVKCVKHFKNRDNFSITPGSINTLGFYYNNLTSKACPMCILKERLREKWKKV